MTIFQSHGTPVNPDDKDSPVDPASKVPSDLVLAREYLKVAPEEYDILAGKVDGGKIVVGNGLKKHQEFYGYGENTTTITTVDADGQTVTENWRVNLGRVQEFLRRTGVSYPELVELTKTRFINPGQQLAPPPADLIVLYSPD